jgi:hypothetical protein
VAAVLSVARNCKNVVVAEKTRTDSSASAPSSLCDRASPAGSGCQTAAATSVMVGLPRTSSCKVVLIGTFAFQTAPTALKEKSVRIAAEVNVPDVLPSASRSSPSALLLTSKPSSVPRCQSATLLSIALPMCT